MKKVKNNKLMKRRITRLKSGRGVLNSAINKLPFEMHMPGYQFCGPGTKLKKRLQAGQQGINELDKACRIHDIAYDKSMDLKDRKKADEILSKRAMTRVKAKNASMSEKLAALTVAGLMKTKSALGAGVRSWKKKKSHKTNQSIRRRRRNLRKPQPQKKLVHSSELLLVMQKRH